MPKLGDKFKSVLGDKTEGKPEDKAEKKSVGKEVLKQESKPRPSPERQAGSKWGDKHGDRSGKAGSDDFGTGDWKDLRNFHSLTRWVENTIKKSDISINVSLLYNKLISERIIKGDQKDSKRKFLESILKSRFDTNYSANNVVSQIKSGLEDSGWIEVFNNSLKNSSPLICGLGSGHALETSLTLHRIWGIPYIPGSSLKGVCRQVAFWELSERKLLGDNEQNQMGEINTLDKLANFQKIFYGNLCPEEEEVFVYQLLFGAQDFKGLLLFLDAYLDLSHKDSKQPFKLEIMNPHYSEYYGDDKGRVIPGDWENPVPIFFLIVKPGVKFRFAVFFDNYRWEKIKREGIEVLKDDKRLIIKIGDGISERVNHLIKDRYFIKKVLKDALEINGVGSKTRLGYGIFQVS